MYNFYLYPRRFHYLKGYVPFLVYFHILLILCILQSLSIDSNFFVNEKSSSVSIFGRFGNRSMLHSSLDTTLVIMQSLSLLSSMFLEMQWNAVTKEISICDSSKSYFSNQSFRSCNFIKKETLTGMFSCDFCEISKNTFFTENLWCLLLVVTMHYIPVFLAAIRKAFRKKAQVPWEKMKEMFLVKNREISWVRTEKTKIKQWLPSSLGIK